MLDFIIEYGTIRFANNIVTEIFQRQQTLDHADLFE